MRLLIHCRFGGNFGWGHLVRMSALAEVALANGCPAILQTAAENPTRPQTLKKSFSSISTEPLQPEKGDVLVVDDHYWQAKDIQKLRQNSETPIVIIDDEGTRDLTFAQLIVNTALNHSQFNYPEDIPACLGPSYALLRPPFAKGATTTRERPFVTIMMGGSDVLDLTPRILEQLYLLHPESHPIVIGSPKASTEQAIATALEKFPQSDWLTQANAGEIADCFRQSHYAFSACGGTLYELAACQTPFIAIPVADNQRFFVAAVEAQWKMPAIQPNELATPKLRAALDQLPPAPHTFPEADGQGASRVFASIAKQFG